MKNVLNPKLSINTAKIATTTTTRAASEIQKLKKVRVLISLKNIEN